MVRLCSRREQARCCEQGGIERAQRRERDRQRDEQYTKRADSLAGQSLRKKKEKIK